MKAVSKRKTRGHSSKSNIKHRITKQVVGNISNSIIDKRKGRLINEDTRFVLDDLIRGIRTGKRKRFRTKIDEYEELISKANEKED
jgi:hypothetical protein